MKPILFNTKMVCAILDGRKTQTRRMMKPQPYRDVRQYKMTMDEPSGCWVWSGRPNSEWFFWDDWDGFDLAISRDCPYGRPGDKLWVRETWGTEIEYGVLKPSELPSNIKIYYRTEGEGQRGLDQWRPSIFMPRWASRITLRITDVRVERVQDISEADAVAEGTVVRPGHKVGPLTRNAVMRPYTHRDAFLALWDSINAKRGYSWQQNPWVWVVEFEVMQ